MNSTKQIALLLLLPFVLVLSCTGGPDTQTSGNAPERTARTGNFTPVTVSAERYEATMAEVQTLIAELNGIIRARNYNAWLGYLADSYLETISSEEFLEERTEELFRRDQIVAQNAGRDPRHVRRRELRNTRDYFDNVVVPSRSNDRLDDIAFVSRDHIIAYTVDSRGQRLILYNLVFIDNTWKIIG